MRVKYIDSIKVNLLRCICDEPFYQILFIVGITFYFSLIYPIASCQPFFKLHLCHKFYIVLYTKMISMFKNSKYSFFSVTPLFFHFILLSSIYWQKVRSGIGIFYCPIGNIQGVVVAYIDTIRYRSISCAPHYLNGNW